MALLELARRSRETPVPVGQAAQEADEERGAAALAQEAAVAGRDEMPAGAADLERTEVEGEPEPASASLRRDVCVRGRVLGQRSAAVAGAEVRLLFRRLDRQRSETRIKPVATGADGTFSFAGRAWRDVELLFEIEHDDFAPALHRDVFHDVGPGQQLDVGDVTLMAGGSVQGSVADADGNAVPVATVRLRPEDEMEDDDPDRWRRFPRIAVQAGGGFRIDHVPAGEYRLDAEAPQFEREHTDMFRVEEGQTVALEPIRLSARCQLTGRVTDAGGAPIDGAKVALLRARGGDWREVRTGKDGWYRFDHIVDDTCSLRIDAKGYLRERRHDIVIRNTPRVDVTLGQGLAIAGLVRDGTGQALERYTARVRCVRRFEDEAQTAARQQFHAFVDGLSRRDAGPSDKSKRQVERERNAQIRGAARRLRAKGIDVDTRGKGSAPDEADEANAPDALLTDFEAAEAHEGGRFEFSGLQEGAYVVEVSAPRHQSRRSQQVELRRGTATPQLVIELERGLAVAGRVVDKVTREGLPNARVELMLPRPAAAAGASQTRALRARLQVGPDCKQFVDTRTDDTGAFVFDQAPPGTYVVRARAKGHGRAWSEPLVLANDVGGLELALGRSGVIHGRVEGLAPEEWRDACVVITDLRSDKTVSVREDATYRADDLPPGKYLVRGWRCRPGDGERAMADWLERSGAELARLREDVDLGEGAEVLFDVRLGPVQAATVSGLVLVDGDGRLAHGFRIRLRELQDDAANAPEPRRFGAAVDQNGGYEISALTGGRYRMSVRVDDERGDAHEVWRQEVFVYAARDNVLPTIALTTTQLAGELAPKKATGTKPAPPAKPPLPGAQQQPKPQGGGR